MAMSSQHSEGHRAGLHPARPSPPSRALLANAKGRAENHLLRVG